MKQHLASVRVLAVTALLGIAGFAIANPDWAAKSPSQGLPKSGSVKVEGTCTPDVPYQTTGAVRVNYWPVGGGAKMVSVVQIPPGKTGRVAWGPFTLSGLTSGTSYNISVEIDLIDPKTKNEATLGTDTKQQAAP